VPGRVPSDAFRSLGNRYDGKQRPKAQQEPGRSWIRIFRRSRAQDEIGSFRKSGATFGYPQ